MRPGIGLVALMALHDITEVALVKLDCEGCEWAVLRSPAVQWVERFIGEYHGVPGLAGVHEALDATHIVSELRDSRPEVHEGLFLAVRR
jgi:hypothetical protein